MPTAGLCVVWQPTRAELVAELGRIEEHMRRLVLYRAHVQGALEEAAVVVDEPFDELEALASSREELLQELAAQSKVSRVAAAPRMLSCQVCSNQAQPS